ncbi:MAG: class I SAM-dependent methyltransferase [Phenylobacterium sp.]|uniref:class I SAM-dependent methyltransferase n=1 Tax=Phenylobacterium sp. TaxID=1871053 RepID=UPI00391DB3B9
MPEPRPYYSDKGLSAAFYDLITAQDASLAGDVELYASLAPAGGSVLELGTGTGRVAFALAEKGLSVLGLDIAPSMLAQAQTKHALRGPDLAARIRFRRGDMTALQLDESFDLVICPFFGLAHLPAGAAWRNVFTGVAGALKPGGKAAFHLPRAESLAGPAPPRERAVLQVSVDDAGRRLSIFVHERKAKAAIGRFDQVVDYVLTDARGREERRSRERLTYYVADPRPFAEAAGLRLEGAPTPLGGVGEVHVFAKP